MENLAADEESGPVVAVTLDRPSAAGGAPLTSHAASAPVRSVQAQLKILNIWNVDTVAETFNVELRITSRWQVSDLPEQARDALENGLDQLDVDWEPEWVPRFSLWGCIARENGRKDYTAQRRGNVGLDDHASSEVWIEGAQWITVQLAETYNLRSFPFDVQDLNIHLTVDNCSTLLPLDSPTCWQKTGSKPGIDKMSMVRHVPLSLPNFRLRFVLYCTHTSDPDVLKQAPSRMRERLRETHRLDVVLLCQRKQRYYIYNYIGLLWCIGTASIASFTVHWREVASRLGIDITLLLVAFAFKHEIASNTPDIAYLTTMDLFAIVVIGFLFLCTLLHSSVGGMIYDCDTLTGECTMGEYWLWDSSVRDEHWNISADIGPSLQRARQDEHMALGYRIDFWCKCIYTALWIGWCGYFWMWHVRHVIGVNAALLHRSRIFGPQNHCWKEADLLPKPMAWWDEDTPPSRIDGVEDGWLGKLLRCGCAKRDSAKRDRVWPNSTGNDQPVPPV